MFSPYCGFGGYPGYQGFGSCGGCGGGIPGYPGFPGIPGTACGGGFPPYPGSGGCSCCEDKCNEYTTTGENATAGDYFDHPTRPCCCNGNCAGCNAVGGDAPWLMPKSVGCGRTHKCQFEWNFALYDKDLDQGAIPGRPPHTIVCIHAAGTSSAVIATSQMQEQLENGATYCDSYDLVLCITTPVEIIVRDCCGFLYCLRSKFSQYVRIPMCAKVHNIGNAQVYVKTRVRLCEPVTVNQYDIDSNTATSSSDAQAGNWNIGCNTGLLTEIDPNKGQALNPAKVLNTVKLDILIEACVMRLIPYGVLAADPTGCVGLGNPPQYWGPRS